MTRIIKIQQNLYCYFILCIIILPFSISQDNNSTFNSYFTNIIKNKTANDLYVEEIKSNPLFSNYTLHNITIDNTNNNINKQSSSNNPKLDWDNKNYLSYWIASVFNLIRDSNKISESQKWNLNTINSTEKDLSLKKVFKLDKKNMNTLPFWSDQCSSYQHKDFILINSFTYFKNRKCDRVVGENQICTCDFGAIFDEIACCEKEYQCLHFENKDYGVCVPNNDKVMKLTIGYILDNKKYENVLEKAFKNNVSIDEYMKISKKN